MKLLNYLRHIGVMGAIAFISLLAIFACVILAPPLLSELANLSIVSDANQGPSAAHWLGTDPLGRDVLSRTLVAVQLSVLLAILAVAIGAAIGIPIGAVTAMLSGRIKNVIVFVIDTAVAFPPLLSAIFFSVILGVGPVPAAFAIGFAYVPYFSRFSRTLAADIGSSDYLAAARMVGVRFPTRLVRYILPNIAEPLIVKATMAVGGAVLAFAGLSFLGLGIQPPDYDLGRLLGNGLDYIYVNPAAALGPAAAVVVIGLVFNYFGEFIAAEFGQRKATRKAERTNSNVESTKAIPVVGSSASTSSPGVDSTGKKDCPIVSVRELAVSFRKEGVVVPAVRGVNLDVYPGEIVGIVGESGSGKSVSSLAIADLLPANAKAGADRLDIAGESFLEASPAQRRKLLKKNVSIVFQDPSAYLNPVLRVERQLVEADRGHGRKWHQVAREKAIRIMTELQIAGASKKIRAYPHEFSGGMRQRLMIAMGMMSSPKLLIADEPTTALDVTVQRRILDQLRELRDEHNMSILLISHDLGVIGHICDRVVVMYGGKIVEELDVADISRARHPYTQALLGASPDMNTRRDIPLMTIKPGEGRATNSCVFSDRCDFATAQCHEVAPPFVRGEQGSGFACWNPVDVVETRMAKAGAKGEAQ